MGSRIVSSSQFGNREWKIDFQRGSELVSYSQEFQFYPSLTFWYSSNAISLNEKYKYQKIKKQIPKPTPLTKAPSSPMPSRPNPSSLPKSSASVVIGLSAMEHKLVVDFVCIWVVLISSLSRFRLRWPQFRSDDDIDNDDLLLLMMMIQFWLLLLFLNG